MKIEEVKKNMNQKVRYGDSEYYLNAVILRKSKGFYYQAELMELSGRSVLIVELEKVQGEMNGIDK